VRKIFLSQRAFVKLFSEAHSKRIREHHEHTLADTPQGVNTFLFIIFRMGQASFVPNQFSLINEKIE
jgi:hypothetical protein